MKTIIPFVIIFSVLLLIPLGYQSVSAGLVNNLGGTFGPNGAPEIPATVSPAVIEDVLPNSPGDYFLINDIVFDPFGFVQQKNFQPPFLAQNLITEEVNNNGIHPIYDWHEEIYPPGAFSWTDPLGTMVRDCSTGAQVGVINPGSNPDAIWIDFDPPILPGECFEIQKTFQQNTLAPFMSVIEYPTGHELDFGDLPDLPYPTLLPPGARHVILPGIMMGALNDGEFDGQPTATADGDDLLDGTDDEDGLAGTALVLGGAPTSISVASTGGGTINVFMSQGGALTFVGSAPAVPLTVIPVDLVTPGFSAGPVDTRIRQCTTADCGTPMGLSLSGEVEDYILAITDVTPPPNPVGGTGIPISTTSLLLAGLDSNYSILMALAVIGFGAFGALYYTTKKKSEESSN